MESTKNRTGRWLRFDDLDILDARSLAKTLRDNNEAEDSSCGGESEERLCRELSPDLDILCRPSFGIVAPVRVLLVRS